MNKKLFLICSFTAATAIASEGIDSQADFKTRLNMFFSTSSSHRSIDRERGEKLLSILNQINDSRIKASEVMNEHKIDLYNFNGMLAISLLSAYLGLGRWACMTAMTLIVMNLESLIRMIEKDLEELDNKSKEQQKS